MSNISRVIQAGLDLFFHPSDCTKTPCKKSDIQGINRRWPQRTFFMEYSSFHFHWNSFRFLYRIDIVSENKHSSSPKPHGQTDKQKAIHMSPPFISTCMLVCSKWMKGYSPFMVFLTFITTMAKSKPRQITPSTTPETPIIMQHLLLYVFCAALSLMICSKSSTTIFVIVIMYFQVNWQNLF